MAKINKYNLRRCLDALMNLHFAVKQDDLLITVKKFFNETTDDEFYSLLEKIDTFEYVDKDDNIWYTDGFIEDDDFETLQTSSKGKPKYLPETWNELMKYVDDLWARYNPEFINLQSFLRREIENESDEESADSVLDMLNDIDTIGFILDKKSIALHIWINNGLVINTKTLADELIELLTQLAYNTKLPSNNGYSYKELFERKDVDKNAQLYSYDELKRFFTKLINHYFPIKDYNLDKKPTAIQLKLISNALVHLYAVIDYKNAYKIINNYFVNYKYDDFIKDLSNLKPKGYDFAFMETKKQKLIVCYSLRNAIKYVTDLKKEIDKRTDLPYFIPKDFNKFMSYASIQSYVPPKSTKIKDVIYEFRGHKLSSKKINQTLIHVGFNINIGQSFNSCLTHFLDLFEGYINPEKDLQTILNAFNAYYPTIRQSLIKGHTPFEAAKLVPIDHLKDPEITLGEGYYQAMDCGDLDPYDFLDQVKNNKSIPPKTRQSLIKQLTDYINNRNKPKS